MVDHCLPAGQWLATSYSQYLTDAMPLVGQWWPYRALLSGLVPSTVDLGTGRQQVSTNMSSTDRLQSSNHIPFYWLYSLVFTKTGHIFNNWLQSLPTRYWLYSLASPKPVTESTHLVHSTLLILGKVDVEAFTRITSADWLHSVPTRCRATQSLF